MKVNVLVELKDIITGKPLFKKDREEIILPDGQKAFKLTDTNEVVTFRSSVAQYLLSVDDSLKDKSKKADRFALAMKIMLNDEIEITETEAEDIRNIVNKHEGPLVYGQIHVHLLDSAKS